MIGIDRIVGVLLDVMPCRRHQFFEHSGIDRRGVGDHLGRDHLQGLESSGEESARRGGVSTLCD
jgi:hypothetical protein